MNLHLHSSLTLPNKLITIYPCFNHQLVSVSRGSSVGLEVPLSFYVYPGFLHLSVCEKKEPTFNIS